VNARVYKHEINHKPLQMLESVMRNTLNYRFLSTAVVVITCSLSSSALAQTVPNTARPDTIERNNRIELDRPSVGGAPIISDTAPAVKKNTGGPSFTLKGIKLEGATVYGEKELEPLYASKLNSKISLDDLNQIAADVTSYYRNKGFILSRAIVPPQQASSGVFTLRIVEGFVNDVRLTGDVGTGNDALLQAYAEKIKNAKPLNADTLERYLLLMEDLPGVEARAVLAPAANVVGASDVIVTIKRRTFEAAASLDNRGSRFLGPIQATGSVFLNNLLGLDDLTQLRISNSLIDSNEMLFGEVRHTEQIGHEGTTLLVSANKVYTKPGESLKPLEIKGESGTISATVTHPIIRSRRTNWFVSGDFTLRDVEVDTLGTSLYKDKTRVLNIGTAYDFVDSIAAINKLEANMAQGFNWGTEKGLNSRSRANGETDFTKFTGKVTRIQPLGGAFSLFTAASGQYSHDPLLASEEFTIGGAEFGSAYDSAEISGDSGAAARAEIQFNQSLPDSILSQYQLYTFYDIGRVWNRNPIAGSEQEHNDLSSAGVGARFNILKSVTGGIEGAVPLTRDVAALNNAGDEPRVFFNLQYRY
jgi:hemolysin activation/secretion protein